MALSPFYVLTWHSDRSHNYDVYNMSGGERRDKYNVTLRRVHVTIVAVQKQ
jgi:hypothetical protein